MVSRQFLCSRRGGISVNNTSQDHAPKRAKVSPPNPCVSGVPQITVSMISATGLFAFLPSRSRAVPSSQAHWLGFKLQASSPTCCKNSQNPICLIFHASGFGKTFFLCIPLCAPLTFLHNDNSLLCMAPVICFSLKPCICSSYPLWYGLISLFSCGVSFLSLQVNLLGMYDDLILI